MIRYSVVIPTKSRSDTLRHVLRNVLSSPREDVEVIVQQCGPDPATDAVAAEVADSRLRYRASSDTVPMRENWERALARATGEFVTVIGDDDGVVPGIFEAADALIASHALTILSWRPVTYYWPGYFDRRLAGRAIYRYDPGVGNVRYSSRYALRNLYRFRWHYSDMPMVYNSFVSRHLVDSIRARRGTYFVLNSPDVTSGAVNAAHTTDFVWSSYPLTITGISSKSTGHRMAMEGSPGAREEALADFMAEPLAQDWIPSVSNLDFSIAAELLVLRDVLGLDEPGRPVSMQDIAEYVARELHKYPQVEASRESLRLFCARHGLDGEGLAASYRLDRIPGAGFPKESSTPGFLQMNRDLAADGDRDICAAARSIAAVLGPPRSVPTRCVGFASGRLRLSGEATEIRFSETGNGPQYLGEGWSRPEAFGTWSSRREATISLPELRFPDGGGRLRLKIAGRGPFSEGGVPAPFSISIAGTGCRCRGEFSGLRPSGVEVLEADVADLPVRAGCELVIRCERLFNPALEGGVDDNRPLGYGLESLSLSFVPSEGPPRRAAG